MKTLKNTLIILTLLAIITPAQAQNLVPNPSFEECDTCPYGSCQIHYANGWHACSGTPDYFHTCSYHESYSVPDNIAGYQDAATGDAYVGIYTFTPGYPYTNVTLRFMF